MADGEIRLSTRVDNSKLGADLAGSANKVKGLTAEFSRQAKVLRDIEKEAAQVKAELDKLAAGQKEPEVLKGMATELKNIQSETSALEKNNAALTASYEEALAQLEQLKEMGFRDADLKTQIAEVDRLAEQLRPFWDQLEAQENKARAVSVAMDDIRLNPSTTQEALDLQIRLEALEQAGAETKERLDGIRGRAQLISVGEAAKNAATDIATIGKRALQSGASIVRSLGSFVGKTLSRLTSVSASAFKGVKKLGAGIMGIGKSAKIGNSGVTKLLKKLTELVKTAFLFSVVSKGLNEIKESAASLIGANAEMTASLNAIKVNLLTAFAPIWQTIQPAILSFLNTIKNVTGQMAAFFAMLNGQTYSAAKNSAQAMQDQAKATDAAGKSAKKAQGHLSALDELMQVAKDDADDMSDSEKGLDFSAVEPPDTTWIDELKAKLDGLSGPLEKGYAIGEAFAEQINKLFNIIDWSTVKAKARESASFLAGMFNGLLENVNFEKLGNSIGEAVNTIFEFFNTGFKLFNWEALGLAVSNGINSIFHTINWETVWNTIASGLNGLVRTINTFLTTIDWTGMGAKFAAGLNSLVNDFDWSLLGQMIGNGINSLCGFLQTAISDINWAQLGANLANGLSSITDTIDWARIGNTIGSGITGVLAMLYNFFVGYDWKGLGSKVATLLNNAISSTDWSLLGKTLGSVINAAVGSLLGLVTTFDWKGIGTALSQSINGIFSEIDWAGIAKMLSTSIVGVFNSISSFLADVDWNAIGRSAAEFMANIDWGGMISAVTEAISNAFKGALQAVSSFFKELGRSNPYLAAFLEFIGGIAIALGAYNIIQSTAVGIATIWGFVSGNAAVGTAAFGASMTGLSIPITAISIAIGALILVLIKLISLFSDASSEADNLGNTISGIGGTIGGYTGGSTSTYSMSGSYSSAPVRASYADVNIPQLANGAVLYPNKPFVAMVGDQRRGVNVETPVATIGREVDRAVGEKLDTLTPLFERLISAVENQHLSVGDRDIMLANSRANARMGIQTGRSVFRNAY